MRSRASAKRSTESTSISRVPENANTWPRLEEIEPARSRTELFDMVWWMYFRKLEPVTPQKTPV